MSEVNQAAVDAALATLKAAPDNLLAGHEEEAAALAVRAKAGNALAGAGADVAGRTEAAAENPLARFKVQYEALPKTNILVEGSTWELVQAHLSDPKNEDKLTKVLKEMDEPRLYAVMENRSLEFVDGNPDTPPMFVKDKKTGEMKIIFKRDPKEMAAAREQIDAGTHQWASVQEMLDWAAANGFEVFEADTKDERWFGKLMKLAEAASPTKLFVGKSRDPWMATALKGARVANFGPGDGFARVFDPRPRDRSVNLGLLRRLRV